MTGVRAWPSWVFAVPLALQGFSCSRADVFPITTESTAGSGGSTAAGQGGTAEPASAGASGSMSACTLPPLAPGNSTHTLRVGGANRTYVLHVPAAYDGTKNVPLVLDFHGAGESAQEEAANSPYPGKLDAEGVVMAFPQGLPGPAGAAWNIGPCCVANVDDVAFARAVVARVEETACIDRTRVYAVGVLTGGGMAHYLACHAADVFAATAPAAFDLVEENVDDCEPARPISVISFRGKSDVRVPYEGGPSALVPGMPLTFLGAQASFERWGRINGCSGSPSPADENGCSAYSGCNAGVEVVLCTEPAGRGEAGDPALAWPILSRHTLPE